MAKTWKKINKRQALKLFEAGQDVYVLPNKANPYSPWIEPALVNLAAQIESDLSFAFDMFCNSYRYYNCNNELGNSLAYYVEKR